MVVDRVANVVEFSIGVEFRVVVVVEVMVEVRAVDVVGIEDQV